MVGLYIDDWNPVALLQMQKANDIIFCAFSLSVNVSSLGFLNVQQARARVYY